MRKIIGFLFVFSIFFSFTVYADTYAVDRADGGVSIINYNEGSKDTLQDVIHDLGFDGRPVKRVSASDLPSTREDRKYWTLQGNKVVVDTAKKQVAEAEKAAKEAEKDAVLAKLKISRAEFEKLNGK